MVELTNQQIVDGDASARTILNQFSALGYQVRRVSAPEWSPLSGLARLAIEDLKRGLIQTNYVFEVSEAFKESRL